MDHLARGAQHSPFQCALKQPELDWCMQTAKPTTLNTVVHQERSADSRRAKGDTTQVSRAAPGAHPLAQGQRGLSLGAAGADDVDLQRVDAHHRPPVDAF